MHARRPEGVVRIGRECPAREHDEAGKRESFGAREGLASGCFRIGPARPGQSVEQHTDEGEIDGRLTERDRARPVAGRGEHAPAVEFADLEIAPARMRRHRKIGIAGAGHAHDRVDDGIEFQKINREMLKLAEDAEIEETIGALAHGCRTEQALGRLSALHIGKITHDKLSVWSFGQTGLAGNRPNAA